MNKYKYLFKNIGLLTLSSFATKLLSFFLVPLYTNILTTTEYGTYDLFNTTVGVLLPILTLNVQDAVMRFAMDSKSNRKAIISVAMKILLVANTVVAVGLYRKCCFWDKLVSKRLFHILFPHVFYAVIIWCGYILYKGN